ncbi:dnaJ homolog subfamily C member 28 [Danio rerio]|uniref:DnaJ (Hsp40) homolog, subfamily C, member 28 n=1 Tax=Danio rerio TaxID=7955 RepID=Q567G4_DANRE|nr:dnaJ homolog subfamily C member 28 [Danio rerio]AAH93182.1 DnaJ (Hsp40) homolog, subfamily C, member 28 [Danio rerio]|eukprot:NP_001017648.1 dnaJ homolog subfamily C member 28 [Danio rerio]
MSCLVLRLHSLDLRRSVLPLYSSLTLRSFSSGALSRSLRESYRLLQLPDDGASGPAEVKEAYLRMAKLYHPDSGAPTADADLFSQIEEAYRAVLAHLARQKSASQYTQSMEEDEDEKVKGNAPQHRQYLSFEGVGSGTPSQRERQYRQFRVDRATDQVLEYRRKEMEKAAAEEGAMVARDARLRSKKIKITQAVERLVEDLIQESMARGDFQNLSGTGKPLNKFDYNPYMDPMTHNLNRILIDNGYQPEWIVAQKEIRESICKMRERLQEVRARLGEPMRHSESLQWKEHCAVFAEELAKLNKKVDNFNLIVPLMSRQMVHYSLTRELEKILKTDLLLRQEKEREKERNEKEQMETTEMSQHTRQGLIAWMQNLLK